MASTTTTEVVSESGLPKGVLDKIKGDVSGIYDNLKKMGIPEQQIAKLNKNQQEALKKLASSGQLQKFAEVGGGELLGAAGALGTGKDVLAKAAAGEMDLTPEEMASFADKLVDKSGLDARIGAMSGDVTRQLQEGALPSIYRNAAGSGNIGSSRSAIAEGVARRGASDAVAKNAALMRAQAQSDAMNRAQTVLGGNLSTKLGAGKGLAGIGSTAIGQMGGVGNIGQQAVANQLQAGGVQQQQAQSEMDVQRRNELMKRLKESGITDAQSMIGLLSGLRGVTDTGASTTTQTSTGPSTSDLFKQTGLSVASGAALKGLDKWMSK